MKFLVFVFIVNLSEESAVASDLYYGANGVVPASFSLLGRPRPGSRKPGGFTAVFAANSPTAHENANHAPTPTQCCDRPHSCRRDLADGRSGRQARRHGRANGRHGSN